MSDERIDIEISDKVDKGVETKLVGIAKAARDGHTAVTRLKAALADINTSSVERLAQASAKTTNALARELNAQARLTTARANAGVADMKGAVQKERLAAETIRLATAEQRLQAETAKTAAAQSRAESAALRLQQAHERQANAARKAADDTGAMQARVERLKASVDPTGSAVDRLNAELAEANTLYAAGVINAQQYANAQTVLQGRIDGAVAAQNRLNLMQAKGGRSAKLTANETLNLSRQFADIGVTAAMGMNPLMILIQQGPQIGDIFQTAAARGIGFRAVLASIWAMLVPLLPVILGVAAAVGLVTGAFALFDRQLRKGYPKDITDGMNLTEEQMDRVKSKTVTFGDTLMATFTVVGRHIMAGPVGKALNWLGDKFSEVMDWITATVFEAAARQAGVMIGSYKTIIQNWRKFPQVFGDFVVSGVNAAIGAIEGLVNKASDGLNLLIRAYNSNPLNIIKLPEVPRAELARMENQYAGAGAAVGQTWAENVLSEAEAARQGMRAIGAEIQTEALRRARARALEEAGDPNKATGGGNRGREEWDRAAALEKVNRELDSELRNMRLLKDAREVQNRLDQISEAFTSRNVPLTKDETAAIREKVEAVQAFARVQSQMDRIYEAVTEPARVYGDTIAAATMLMAQGQITTARYIEEVRKAGYEYRMATDPLLTYNMALDDQIAALSAYGPALERVQYLQQLQNALAAQGKTLYDASTGALTAEAAALMAKFDQLQRGLVVQQEVNALYADVTANDLFLANLSAMYAEVERMRSENILSEGQAAQAIAKLNAKYYQVRLQSTSDFFGNLATLSSSGNKKIAAIGKAAAVAQATIDGILAVQKALASAPPPWNYAMAASVGIAAAANVANILSQGSQGFAGGGWTGNGAVNTIAGAVHGQEFVVKAGPAARHRDMLEALNAGRDPSAMASGSRAERASYGTNGSGKASDMPPLKISIQNFGSSVITAERVSADEVRVIAREVAEETVGKKVPALVGAELSDPNSKGRKALARHTTVQPNR